MNLFSFLFPSYRLFDRVDERLYLFYRVSFCKEPAQAKRDLEFQPWHLVENSLQQGSFEGRSFHSLLFQPHESFRLWVHSLMEQVLSPESTSNQKAKAENFLSRLVQSELMSHPQSSLGIEDFIVFQFRIAGAKNFEGLRGEALAYFVSAPFENKILREEA